MSAASPSQKLQQRGDGRLVHELRARELQLSILNQFDGSCSYTQGQTSVTVSVQGPTLSKQEDYERCHIHMRVIHMDDQHIVPSAGGAQRLAVMERQRNTLNEDSADLLSTLQTVAEAVVLLDRFPRCVISIDVTILHCDGSLLATCVNAMMAALLDAGLPCRTTAAAVTILAIAPVDAASAVASSPELVLDPTLAEEKGLLVMTDGRYLVRACGTFTFSNPLSGGGVLCTSLSRSSSHSAAAANLSTEELMQMYQLGETAAQGVFSFFRQCNVPL